MNEEYQVIVVGGGPVGVALAVDLGLRGISCALIERREGLQNIPKGQNLTPRTLEHFYFWGIADELRAARVLPKGYPIGGIVTYKSLMSEYWYPPAQREVVRPYYFQDVERLPQYLTERVLRDKMATLPSVTSLMGWNADSIAQDDDGVTVGIVHANGERRTLRANYLVGCDGAHSFVRRTVAIGNDGIDFDTLMVLAVFRSRQLHEALKRFPERSTFNVLNPELHGFWQFFGRIDVGEGFFFHAPVPSDSQKETFDFKGTLERAAGFAFEAEYDYLGFWDNRVMTADRYQVDRVLIAGDAAHSHPPYGGYGLNTGLEDATNLGWKLAAVLDGWGGEALLRSYGDERRPVFKDTGEKIIAAGIKRDDVWLAEHDPDRDRSDFERAWEARKGRSTQTQLAYEPHYEGSPVVDGPPDGVTSALGTHTWEARPGHHLPPQPLSDGKNVFERLGSGYTLLAFDADEASIGAFRDAAKAYGIPLDIVRDTAAGCREAYGRPLILVRPDQYVVWAGERAPGDPASLVAKVTGRA
jgi:2-polyprenyl-6-methoxyphenol hydroxylase-like FAD-dependent oxidoreductase